VRTLGAALLVLALLGPSLGAAPAPQDWRAKADGALQAAVDQGQGLLRVLVEGPPLSAPAHAPADRAAWRAHWARAAEPFLAEVRSEVQALGGRVTSEVAPIDAAFAVLPAGQVPDLLALPDVRRAGLDAPDSVRILQGGGGGGVALADALAMLHVQDLWAQGYRGEGVKLAVVDTGLRDTHDVFRDAANQSRVAGWADATSPMDAGWCATPCDTNGHGTHTASTAAGSNAWNASAPLGAAPNVTLFAVRILRTSTGSWEDAQAGVQAAFDLGADVTSNSWGGGCDEGGLATARLVENLTDAGMLSVFAAGNNGGLGINCPGAAARAITVGAVDAVGNVASFSSQGPCAWPPDGPLRACPDVVAMGVGLTAAWNACDDCYATLSGTSMATPQVAGLTALLMQARKALGGPALDAATSQAEVLERYTATDLAPTGPDDATGWGLPNATAALGVLAAPVDGDVRGVLRPVPAEVRVDETALLRWSVANLGPAAEDGNATLTANQLDAGLCPPTCETLAASAPAHLAPLTEATASMDVVGAAHNAGHYAVHAAFDGPDPVSADAAFLLTRVQLAAHRSLPALVETARGYQVVVQVTNLGNVEVASLDVTDNVPAPGLVVLPRGVNPPNPVFSNPPSEAPHFDGQGRLVLDWYVGALAPGATWNATYTVMGGAPGAYVLNGTLSFVDDLGRSLVQRTDQPVSVMPFGP
jgi:subtilisin family serine protease